MTDGVLYIPAESPLAGAVPKDTEVKTTETADGHVQHVNVDSGTLFYRSSDATYQPARLDKSTNSIQVVEYEHHEIHAGSHFFTEDVVDLSINNVYDLQLTTPSSTKWTHFTFVLQCEAETEWYIYEGATINQAGTTITPINNNRNYSTTASTDTLAGITNTSVENANADTAVAGATQLAHGIVGAGRTGGIDSRSKEIILKSNTVYCFRAIATAAGYINFLCEWYEHTDIA